MEEERLKERQAINVLRRSNVYEISVFEKKIYIVHKITPPNQEEQAALDFLTGQKGYAIE
jgi:hypothetical protein